MDRKPFTTRTALIALAALTTGSTAGAAVDAATATAGGGHPGRLATTLVALWTMDLLHRLIGDDRR